MPTLGGGGAAGPQGPAGPPGPQGPAGTNGTQGPPTLTVLTKNASFTLSAAEAGYHYECSSPSAIVVTIPLNATVAIPVGTMFEGHKDDAGAVSFTTAAGVNCYMTMGTACRAVGSPWQLIKLHTDAWLLSGDLQ